MLRYVQRKRRLTVATTQYSVKIRKHFPYRGATKEWSNRYYFDGSEPTDNTAWYALMDAVVLLEKSCYTSWIAIDEAFGYGPTSDVAVASKAYSTGGTLDSSGGTLVPGDCAAVLRQATTKMSVKNHPVYVFSYFHGPMYTTAGTLVDTLLATQKTAIQAFGTAWVSGISVGARTYKRCTPDGHLVTGSLCNTYIGHRDFPR